MVMIAVKQIRGRDRARSTSCFDGGESGMIVDDIVVQKCFLTATAAKIQSGRVVERARGADGSKQEIILAIPEAMFRDRQFRTGIEDA